MLCLTQHIQSIWSLSCCCCSVAQLCLTLCDLMDCSASGLHIPHHLLKFAQVHVHCIGMPSSHLIFWHPLLLFPSLFPTIRVFSTELAVHIRWPKYWSFSFSISPSSEYSGLISLNIDWFLSPCCWKDSQKSSPAPRFKEINSLALCLLYGPALTNTRDQWEDHSLDYMDPCLDRDLIPLGIEYKNLHVHLWLLQTSRQL